MSASSSDLGAPQLISSRLVGGMSTGLFLRSEADDEVAVLIIASIATGDAFGEVLAALDACLAGIAASPGSAFGDLAPALAAIGDDASVHDRLVAIAAEFAPTADSLAADMFA